MADELPTPVEQYTLTLVAGSTLPPTAWEDFRRLLTPSEPQPDPAPDVEFAHRELPDEVAAQVLSGIVMIASANPRREAARAANPPPLEEHLRRVVKLAARIERIRNELRDLGCQLEIDI